MSFLGVLIGPEVRAIALPASEQLLLGKLTHHGRCLGGEGPEQISSFQVADVLEPDIIAAFS